MISTTRGLIEEYNAGVWSEGDLFYQLTRLIPDADLDEVCRELPPEMMPRYTAWLSKMYADNVDVSTHVLINAESTDGHAVKVIREWLARRH